MMTTIDAWISRWAATDKLAFRFEGRAISYRELGARIDATADGLAEIGVGVGDRVGFCGLNRVEIFEALFACARLGAILLPLNNRLSSAELNWQIDDSDPTVLLTTDGFIEPLQAAAGQRLVRDLDRAPFATGAIDSVPTARSSSASAAPVADADADAAAAADADVSIESAVLMVYTSGTTGHPKGAVLSQNAILHTVLNAIEHQGLGADDRIIAPLPTFHVGGLTIQTLPALRVGAEVILHRRFDPGAVLADIEELRPTQTLLVPAMLSAVSAHPAFSATDLSCLTGIATGSSVVPEAVIEPFLSRGVPVAQVYGATETGPTSIAMSYGEVGARPSSCGRRALHTEYRIVDPATGVDAACGDDGEIWLRGPNLFDRYWNNPGATAEAFVDGWYRTGDVGRCDADGYVWISDRLTDLIISGGENIYPAEVEAVLIEHPAVAEVAVIGRSDDRWGEVAVAVVVPTGEIVDIEQIRTWSADRLARYKLPRELITTDSLPRTALGKVQKHLLRSRVGFAVPEAPSEGQRVPAKPAARCGYG